MSSSKSMHFPNTQFSADLLPTLLDVSLSGMICLKPIHNTAGDELLDFDYVHLNRAAQAMLDLPESPTQSFLTLNSQANQLEVFAFFRDTFISGEPARFHVNDRNYHVSYKYSYISAARSGSLLLASFADNVSLALTPLEQAIVERKAGEKLAASQLETKKTREALEQLAQELEDRVARRTLELEQERQRFRQIFEKTPALIAILKGPEHVFSFVNPAFQRMFPDRQLIGNPYAMALPEAYEQGFGDKLNNAYTTGAPFIGNESPLRYNDGEGKAIEVYFNFTFQPYGHTDTEGMFIFAFEVSGELEARKEAEMQRQLLHTLFMEAPSPIVILNGPDFIFQLVNPAYQKIFPGRILNNKPLLDALPELTNTPINDILKEVYLSGETFVASEMPLMLARYTGGPLEEIFWTFTCQARRNIQDLIDGVLVFAHDVTDQVLIRREVESSEQQTQLMAQELAYINDELRAANEEILSTNNNLADSNSQLIRINSDLDNFIYTASHDLKSPISNIEGLLAVLIRTLTKEESISEDVNQITTLMQLSVDRFKRTIINLTDVVKLQKENNSENIPVALSEVIKEVQLDIAMLISNSDAELIVQVDDSSNIKFSEKNLRSVVYNLLSNAIKYCCPDRKPVIRISCQTLPEYHVLTITDNGLGMDHSQTGNLFTMFKRFHNHVEGSGIGLYMVKRMVENAGGKIEVESQVGVGTSFKVYFVA